MEKNKLKQVRLTLFILIIFSILTWTSCSACFGEKCRVSIQDKKPEKYTLNQLVQAIDKEIRRAYWYYLDDSLLVFQYNVDVPTKKTIHFYIYRNKIGTYLAVVSRKKQTSQIILNNLVRLGYGFIQDIPASGGMPAFLQPFMISLRLSPEQLVVDQIPKNQTIKQVTYMIKQKQKDRLERIDKKLRTDYWYYLSQAFLISSSSLTTTQRTYSILSFINITGTYLVIASIDAKNNVKVNNLIRLGAGTNTNQMKPIQTQPQVLVLR